jgi:hypothetical protein
VPSSKQTFDASDRAKYRSSASPLASDGLSQAAPYLALFNDNPNLVDKIIWSDESMLNGTVNRHNCCYYAYSNEHRLMPVSNSKDGVMVWCGLTSKGLLGPYFFGGSVRHRGYLFGHAAELCVASDETPWPLLPTRWTTRSS